MRRQRPAHPYPRVARVSELVHQILADELERIDDERLHLVTVMSVSMEQELRHAVVVVDNPDGADRDVEILESLGEHRWLLQKAVGNQARLKHTPTLSFQPDEVTRAAHRIESVLRSIPEPVAMPDPDAEAVEATAPAPEQ
jgi:ribosome-binding factor A